MNKEDFWQAVLGEIELTLSKASFTTWFKNTFVMELDKDSFVINVPNIFAKEWLEKKYKKIILDAARKQYPKINKMSCVISSDKEMEGKKTIDSIVNLKDASANKGLPKSRPYNLPNSGVQNNLNPRYQFENFVVGSNNELSFAACKSVAENPGENYNPLFIYGGVGLGKTHLLHSVGNEIKKKNKDAFIRYVGMERFANELLSALQNSKAREFKNDYIKLDVLIIDDVQFLAKKEKTQEEFFHVFETLYQHGKQIIISSDRPPKSIPTLEDRLRSRFEGGMIADITKPDLETRMAIVQKKLNEKNFSLNRDIVEYLAESIYHNVRELEGALNKIIAIHQLTNKTPRLEDVAQQIQDHVSVNRQKKLDPEKVIKCVAEFFDINKKEILEKSRKKKLIKPRQIAIYLIREEVGLSFPEIGTVIGGRDHSTVIYAYEKIKKELPDDEILSNHLKYIKEKFIDY